MNASVLIMKISKFLSQIEKDAILLASSPEDITDTQVQLCIERHGHLFANCLDAVNGNHAQCIELFNTVQEAYKVSGFGESLIISFLQGDYLFEEMYFLIDLAGIESISQLRKERAIAKKGSPFFPSRKVRNGKNILGRRLKRYPSDRRK